MSMLEKYIKQCRKPEGRLGRFVGVSMNRGHSKLRKWGLSFLVVQPDAIVLDIGCGGGKTVQEFVKLAPQGKTYGIDYSETMVELARTLNQENIANGRAEIKHGTVSDLPFHDEMFDVVTAFETCYFWPDIITDLNEIQRVLKTGGKLIIVNEAYHDQKFEKRNEKFAKMLEMSIYTPNEYRNFMTEAGYNNVQISMLPEKNWIMAMAEK